MLHAHHFPAVGPLMQVTGGLGSLWSGLVVSLQLKEKHRQSGGGVGALEELENAFSLAEESCPGISDQLMAHLVERVQR